ncbi:MAG: hypothetical protein OQK82_05470, partial [Candidatus Pacearchaeota archaeon]|nr:hypothetical protein [Candidatus Pacearchaeota archaeon]
TSIRDCQWISEKTGDENLQRCVPLVSPGFNFFSEEEGTSADSSSICSLGSSSCTAHYEKSLADEIGISQLTGGESGWKQVDGEECFNEDMDYLSEWGEAQNKYCASLGDCQGELNGDKDSAIIEIVKNYLGYD